MMTFSTQKDPDSDTLVKVHQLSTDLVSVQSMSILKHKSHKKGFLKKYFVAPNLCYYHISIKMSNME